mmetsp:Transcript_42301/g.132554  ORF Transcript_42301/g.132554 Transcript_42301/m.132554 type:complete len:490 (+) Transcript_42301:1963-3432(+)
MVDHRVLVGHGVLQALGAEDAGLLILLVAEVAVHARLHRRRVERLHERPERVQALVHGPAEDVGAVAHEPLHIWRRPAEGGPVLAHRRRREGVDDRRLGEGRAHRPAHARALVALGEGADARALLLRQVHAEVLEAGVEAEPGAEVEALEPAPELREARPGAPEAVRGPGADDLHGVHDAHAVHAIAIVAAQQQRERDEVAPREPQLARAVRRGVRLDELLVLEDVFVDHVRAEGEAVRVLRDDAVHEPQPLQLGALRLRLRRRHDVRHAEDLEQLLHLVLHLLRHRVRVARRLVARLPRGLGLRIELRGALLLPRPPIGVGVGRLQSKLAQERVRVARVGVGVGVDARRHRPRADMVAVHERRYVDGGGIGLGLRAGIGFASLSGAATVSDDAHVVDTAIAGRGMPRRCWLSAGAGLGLERRPVRINRDEFDIDVVPRKVHVLRDHRGTRRANALRGGRALKTGAGTGTPGACRAHALRGGRAPEAGT